MNTTMQEAIVAILGGALGPLTFGQVRSELAMRIGEGAEYRAVDRALQALRKRKTIEYRKTSGEKATHGWALPTGSADK